MMWHTPDKDIAQRCQKRAAMVVHNALWITGRSRGVVESDCLPLVRRPAPREFVIPVRYKLLIFLPTQSLALCRVFEVIHVDDQRSRRRPCERLLDSR